MNFLANLQEQAYAVMRIVTGYLFLWHGTQIHFNYPIDFAYGTVTTPVAIAGVVEIVGGALVLLGLFTRPAAFICSGAMAVAYWMVHGLKNFFPIANGGELSAFYCFVFLFIATKGAGVWSLDTLIGRSRSESS